MALEILKSLKPEDPGISFHIVITSKWGLLMFIYEPANEFSLAMTNFMPTKQQV